MVAWWFDERIEGREPTVERAMQVLRADFAAATHEEISWGRWTPSDLRDHAGRLVPTPSGRWVPSIRGPERHRTLRNGLERLKQDCELLDVRPMGGAKATVTQHECRNTFITLSQAGGGAPGWVRRITHNASGDVLAGYTNNDWGAMCEAVMAIPVQRRRGAEVIRLPLAVGARPNDGSDYGVHGDGKAKAPCVSRGLSVGTDGTRTRGLRRDRPAL